MNQIVDKLIDFEVDGLMSNQVVCGAVYQVTKIKYLSVKLLCK